MEQADFCKALARKCRAFRNENEMSQAELAAKCGLGERTIRDVELAKARGLSMANLFKILETVNAEIGFLDVNPPEFIAERDAIADKYLEERAERRTTWAARKSLRS